MGLNGFQPFVIQAIGSTQAVEWQLILALVLSCAISSFKIAMPDKWTKLNALRVFVAPAISLVITFLIIRPFTFQGFIFSFTTGAGAIAWHEIQTALQVYIAKTGIKLPFGDHFVYGVGVIQPVQQQVVAQAAAPAAPAADTSSQNPPAED